MATRLIPLVLSLVTISWSLPFAPLTTRPPRIQSVVDPSYFTVFPDGVWFIQWTDVQGSLSGQFQRVYVTSDNPLVVQSENTQFSGVRNGSDLSLKMGGFFPYATWTGTVRGATLSLTIPDRSGLLATVVLRAGTVEDYNKAASSFRARIAQEAAAAERERQRQAAIAEQERQRLAMIAAQRQAVTQADDAVVSALRSLSYNVRQLAEHSQTSNFQLVLKSYADHWAKMQADYEILKIHAEKRPFNCYQLSVVKYDLSTLEYDLSSIRYDNSSFNYAGSPIANGLSEVARDISKAQTAMEQLQSAVLTNAPKPPRGALVYLENHSTGNAAFYIDGQLVCTAPSGCTIVLQGSHRLYAVASGAYHTPQTTLTVREGDIYRYLACGAMGTPSENCGLFVVTTPSLIDAATQKANEQAQASQKPLEEAAGQRDEYNRNAERLLQDAKDFVSSLTCSQ